MLWWNWWGKFWFSSAGFSRWGLVLAWTQRRRLTPALLKPLTPDFRLCGDRLRLQDFVDQKKIREQRAQVDRRV